jgi:Tol biopolymer transport system component/predicted Ser/Thr protein kinase
MIDRVIDRYRVVEELGRGGMGVVYRARDTVLDRYVALKVLPPDKLSDPDRRQRLLQEARSASALNHPGIVAIHDVRTVDGQDVIVMELVEGETLEQLLSRRRLPLGTALGHAIRIAEALARAHAAGIVHRDLKPSNVMVTTDGEVKILDFGLAKLTEAPFPHDTSRTQTRGAAPLTEARMIVGTVAYMSPEQASGLPVDARSDVFAFGVMLHEMLTGKHPLRRDSTLETLEAIRDPRPDPPSGQVPSLPPEIDRAVLRCLRKEPKERWQSLSDLKAILEDLKEDSESGRRIIVDGTPERSRSRRWILGVGVALVMAVLAVGTVLLLRAPDPAESPLALRRLTYDRGLSAMPDISADGKLVVYSSDRGRDEPLDLWVQYVNQPTPARLTEHPADDWTPDFSPDGSRIVYHSLRDGGGLYMVNTLGGEERKIASGGTFPHFSPDGTRILYVETPERARVGLMRMFLVPADGGVPRPFLPAFGAAAPPGSVGPVWSPDGRFVLFKGAPFGEPGRLDWWVAPVDGGDPVSSGALQELPRIDVVQLPCAWLPGRVLFLAGTTFEGVNLYSASITPEGRITGPMRALTAGPGLTWTPSVSRDGRIALSRFQWVIRLWEVPIDPASGRALGEPRQVPSGAAPSLSMFLTRDGSRLAYSAASGSRDRRRSEIHLQDLASGEETVPVSLPANLLSLRPRLSADATMLSWTQIADGRRVTLVAPAAEPTRAREVCEDCAVLGFFSDGSEVLVLEDSGGLDRRPLEGGSPIPVAEFDDAAILDADLSWDDRWVALATRESEGRSVVRLVPLRDGGADPAEGTEWDEGDAWVGCPRWSPDGRFLFYLSDRDDFICVWARPLDPVTKRPAGEPTPVVHAHHARMNLSVPTKTHWSLTVGRDRLVFNAAEMTGEVYTAQLEAD